MQQDGWHFIVEDDLIRHESSNKELTRTVFMQAKTDEILEFSFSYGINNHKIEKVNLHMTIGEKNDRYAIVQKIEGQRVSAGSIQTITKWK
jgi:hypothetical protein